MHLPFRPHNSGQKASLFFCGKMEEATYFFGAVFLKWALERFFACGFIVLYIYKLILCNLQWIYPIILRKPFLKEEFFSRTTFEATLYNF